MKKFENLKIQDGCASDFIILPWLLWKPIKQQVISINWNYKERSLYVQNI